MGKDFSKGRKSIALTTAVSLLGSSCSSYLEPFDDPTSMPIQDTFTRSLETKKLPLSELLTDDEYAFLDAIIHIAEDLANGNFNSRDLESNIQEILLQYGYEGKILPDSSLMKILIAFGDSDFVDVINNHDLSGFIRLAKEKGLIRKDNPIQDLSGIDNLPETTKNLIAKIVQNKVAQNQKTSDGSSNFDYEINDWFVDSIAVAAVMVLVGIEVAVIVMIIGLEAPQNLPIEANEEYSSKLTLNRLMQAKQVDVWDAYIQTNGINDIYTFVDERVNKLCDATLLTIDELAPEYWNEHSRNEVRNKITLLYMNYILECENEREI